MQTVIHTLKILPFYFTDRNPYIIRPLPEMTDMAVFGTKPPEKESFEDICGPPTTCPECPDPRFAI